jgi:FAD:protein FMN transferase
MAADARFRAMGSEAHVVVTGGTTTDLDRARRAIEELEAMWSRFRETSEISALNASRGSPVVVSEPTFSLVERALEGYEATGGLFDPMLLREIVALGYDRSFEQLPNDGGPLELGHAGRLAGRVVLDRERSEVTVPRGSGFDPGGIGKGYAADLVARELLDRRGVRGVCVNIGGDLRARGEAPEGDAWVVQVEDPWDRRPLGRVALEDGAIATTTRMRRRWWRGNNVLHHVLDPATSRPADSGLASVTVVAGEGWWAEVMAKAAFVAGPEDAGRLLAEGGCTGIGVDDEMNVLSFNGSPLVPA